MKEKTKEIIDNLIVNENFIAKNLFFSDNLIRLYRIYSLHEIHCLNDVYNSYHDFFDYLLEQAPLIAQLKNFKKETIIKSIKLLRNTLFKNIRDLHENKDHCCYTNILNYLVDNPKSAHIMDIGPGNMPYSSMLLGQNFSSVCAMEKEFDLSTTSLKRMNIEPIRHYFIGDMNIDDFDIITGKRPCSAIDTIVYLCKKYQKPYFIELCHCEIPSKETLIKRWGLPVKDVNKIDESLWYSWKNILPLIDKDISFSENYAYNVGYSKKEIDKLILDTKLKTTPCTETINLASENQETPL